MRWYFCYTQRWYNAQAKRQKHPTVQAVDDIFHHQSYPRQQSQSNSGGKRKPTCNSQDVTPKRDGLKRLTQSSLYRHQTKPITLNTI